MEETKTLFYLGTDTQGVFDKSVKGYKIIANPKVRDLGNERMVQINKGGYIKLDRSSELDRLSSFTLEAFVRPRRIGDRMNIIEAQQPSVALFIDPQGKLVGSVHTANGWQSVDSGNSKLTARKNYFVRFSREPRGKLILEINENEVGSKQISESITNVGNEGFIIGAGIGGRSFLFSGNIGDVRIRSGSVTNKVLRTMKNKAKSIENNLKAFLSINNIAVELDHDVSYAMLQPIKNILNAVGVQNISDMDTLQIKTKTVMTPGKIMIAPKKAKSMGMIDWAGIARTVGTLSVAGRQKLIAKYLTNRNSKKILKKALPSTASRIGALTPTGLRTGVITRPRAHVLHPLTTVSPITALSAVSRFSRISDRPVLADMIKLDSAELEIKDAAITDKLEGNDPENWPSLGGMYKTLMAVTTLPINTAVIIAGTFDLTNTELVVEPEVETLYIIAEKIICGTNAKITWRRPGGSTPARMDDPSLNGRGYSGVHQKPGSRDGLDGENGRAGTSGINGAKGLTAPKLEIWVKNMSAMPNFDMNGENGIKGGKGQRGGRGGDGADGHVGRKTCFFKCWCSTGAGDGGDGGDGGNGGNGGRGGSGSNGGNITIGVLDETLESTVTSRSFKIKNQGGQKGRGGDRGDGGRGGSGGYSGNGKYCHNAENGHNGAQGQPGRIGADGTNKGSDGEITFLEFTEEAWDDLLTRPWIMELDPEYIFPGNTLRIKGSRFTHHDRVHVGNLQLAPVVNPDESLSVVLPNNISGGEKIVSVKRQDGTESNRLKLWVKPQLDVYNGVLNPGASITLTGRAFVSGASVIVDGQANPANVSSATRLNFTMPDTGGTGSNERNVSLQVRNPDGMMSNIRTAYVPGILEIPFKFGIHDFSFKNFSKGSPSWSTYQDTFGAVEIWHEQLDPLFGHPILTAAFYAFYHYFLKGTDSGGLATGFCTALSAVVLDEFWTGSTDTHSRYTLNAANRKRFTAIHGKLLSRESLIHFHDQSQEENARVEKTYREIEKTFFTGCDRNNAPMLFFIPSGAVWDSGYIDKLGSTHCIVPVRFVYPQGHGGPKADGTTDPDGVSLYCWDCNHPPENDSASEESENCRLVFRRTGGEIRFDYYNGGSSRQFFSEDGITLGMMTNGKYHLSDHDLPFSGPLGVTRFVIDFLLSPADLQVVDSDGLRTGLFGNQILSEIPEGRPCYLAKGAYMLPVDTPLTRKIIGNGNGKYTFNSITPDGTSLALEDVSTQAGQEDILAVNADGTQIRFTPAVDKTFTLTLARQVEDEVRAVTIKGLGGGPAADVDIAISPELSLCRIGNRSGAKTVSVRAFSINSQTQAHSKIDRSRVSLPTNHDLVMGVTDWVNLDLSVEAVPFE